MEARNMISNLDQLWKPVCFISGCQRQNGLHQYKKEHEKDTPDQYSLF